jgi:hypothetical protein
MGLRGGASPALLQLPASAPAASPRRQRKPAPLAAAPPPCAVDSVLEGGNMPSAAVLARSSFLHPLPADGAAEWADLLRAAGCAA